MHVVKHLILSSYNNNNNNKLKFIPRSFYKYIQLRLQFIYLFTVVISSSGI